MNTDVLPEQLIIAHGPEFKSEELAKAIKKAGFQLLALHKPEDCAAQRISVVILDSTLLSEHTLGQWKKQCGDAILACEDYLAADTDVLLPSGLPLRSSLKTLQLAANKWVLAEKNRQLKAVLKRTRNEYDQLADIGIALSAEKDLSTLLNRILAEGQRLVNCDAASLFLVDRSQDKPALVFKLTLNLTRPIPFNERRFPLDGESIVGYVASHGRELNIADAYAIPETAPYSFNSGFDEMVQYRTISLLALPMQNHRDEIVGVLEFINRKPSAEIALTGTETDTDVVLPFPEQDTVLLRALASLSAVAIQNAVLIDSVNRLFDGFVKASVAAIEQRDPTTSGHSFRVADLCVALAEKLPQAHSSKLRQQVYTHDQLRELRYAALLHDFGKVGVREDVLVKPKKLTARQLDLIEYRIKLTKERLKSQALQKVVEQKVDPTEQAVILHQLELEIKKLDRYLLAINQANEPSILHEDRLAELNEIGKYHCLEDGGVQEPLLRQDEFLSLSIRKGSLTEEEREEIQSHVVHTLNFLRLIPWTSELRNIPEIAGSHHEKLDGTGYPDGLTAEEIPISSKIMTVCDIYDALTAADRPYKAALPTDRALNILQDEVQRGQLDSELVSMFIDARIYDAIDGKTYRSPLADLPSRFHHHVCDIDLHSH